MVAVTDARELEENLRFFFCRQAVAMFVGAFSTPEILSVSFIRIRTIQLQRPSDSAVPPRSRVGR